MTRSCFLRGMQLRWKSKYALIENVEELLVKKELKHKHHPGIVIPGSPPAPEWLYKAIQAIIKGYPVSTKQVVANAEKLAAQLHGRLKPPEEKEIQEKLAIAQARLAVANESNDPNPLQSKKGKTLVKQLIHKWKPIEYNETISLAYLVGRSLQNYTVLSKIFGEMKSREPMFKPYTLLDFGSGVGTVLWAANTVWGDSLQEHLCIDISNTMHEYSERLISDGKLKIKGVFYREHIPASPMPKYDIVTSAYSLLELPNASSRLEVLAKLWEKTDRYLVLVEHGTNAGFKVLNEAREFILSDVIGGSPRVNAPHVSAPCPHNLPCPRYTTDNTPCNFPISYLPFPIFKPTRTHEELYSYVVLRKGKLANYDDHFPRIVRPVLKRSRHVICRMCTNRGKLEEEIFTAFKSGKNAYRCARSSSWGDRLPVKLVDTEDTSIKKSGEEEAGEEPNVDESNQTTEEHPSN